MGRILVNRMKIATKPKYRTKDGETITFKWVEKEEEDPRGWVVHKLIAFVEGKMAGYLKISYIPGSRWKRLYPTFWHWERRDRLNEEGERWLKDPFDRDLLARSIGMHFGYHYGNLVIETTKPQNLDSMSKQEYKAWVKLREKLLENYRKSRWDEYEMYLTKILDRPLVDFIQVDPKFQRRYIALALYQEGARRMAKKGLPLYASTIQSAEAAKAWTRMKSMKKIPLIQDGGGTKIDYTTRFRK